MHMHLSPISNDLHLASLSRPLYQHDHGRYAHTIPVLHYCLGTCLFHTFPCILFPLLVLPHSMTSSTHICTPYFTHIFLSSLFFIFGRCLHYLNPFCTLHSTAPELIPYPSSHTLYLTLYSFFSSPSHFEKDLCVEYLGVLVLKAWNSVALVLVIHYWNVHGNVTIMYLQSSAPVFESSVVTPKFYVQELDIPGCWKSWCQLFLVKGFVAYLENMMWERLQWEMFDERSLANLEYLQQNMHVFHGHVTWCFSSCIGFLITTVLIKFPFCTK